METITDKIITLLKKEDLNILESIEVLRAIEDAFLEQLKENTENDSDNWKMTYITKDNIGEVIFNCFLMAVPLLLFILLVIYTNNWIKKYGGL